MERGIHTAGLKKVRFGLEVNLDVDAKRLNAMQNKYAHLHLAE